MHPKKIKWLIYTVLVGLIPTICRVFMHFVIKDNSINVFSASDFVAFGLVLHISNINELEHLTSARPAWKTAHNGVSVLFIAVYNVLFAASLLGEKNVNSDILLYSSVALSVVSLLISYAIYFEVSRIP